MGENLDQPKTFGSYAGLSKRTYYDKVASALWTERSSFDSHWQDLANYFQPRRTRFFESDRNKGDKRNRNIIDATGRLAARTLSSGLHAGLTSPARPWMKLTTPDPQLAEFGPVREWLHLVTARMLTVFLQSNLYNALPVLYGDLGIFGTAALALLDDTHDTFRAYNYPLGSFAIGVDNRGLVCTFVRRYQLSVRALIQEFALADNGDIEWAKLSSGVRSAYIAGNVEAPVDVTWMVHPNPEHDRDRLGAKYYPWASCHFETGRNDAEAPFLRESGYREFPILAPRWAVTGEDSYGTECPGMDTLGDNRQLQLMHKEKAKAVSKMVTPPLQAPTSLMTQKVSQIPGELTYVDVREQSQGVRAIHDIGLNLQHLDAGIADIRYMIRRGFYEDLFLMLAQSEYGQRGGAPITAREVDERHEEKLLALGPVLERTNDEALDPLVDRVFAMMVRRGLIPDPPEELDGVPLKVEYISIMAQAQKLVGVTSVDRFLTSVLPIAQAYPEARFKIDPFQLVDDYADMLGVNPKVIRTTKDAQADAAREKQQAQQAQLAAQAKDVTTALKNAGETPMDGDTALARIAPQIPGLVNSQSAA